MIHHLNDNQEIDIITHNNLIANPNTTKNGTLYILPKLHKPKFKVRPIISNIDHPTENISKFLHKTLLSTAKSAPTYIGNSQELINILKTTKTNQNSIIITADITSLYTNIPTKTAIKHVTTMYNQHNLKNKQKLKTNTIMTLLNNCLNNNIFTFDNQHFLQINGTAMGTTMAPTYANCYLKSLEESWKQRHPQFQQYILLFKRYIDDLILIYDNSNNDLETFIKQLEKCYQPLEITIESGKKCNYLDLTLEIDHNNQITHNIYQKTTTPNILTDKSNHPTHIKENIIINEMKRINRLSQSYLHIKQKETNLLISAHKNHYKPKRLLTLTKKSKHKTITKKSPNSYHNTIKLTYNQDTKKLKDTLHKLWTQNNINPTTGEAIKPPTIIYQMNKSLKKHLIRAKQT